jgi:hypothetical protein
MATAVLNSSAQTSANTADGTALLRIRQNAIVQRMVAAYGNGLPADFTLVFHNDLRYTKRGGELSEQCYCGLVPKFNGVEHLELAMFQWDLLAEDIPTYKTSGKETIFDQFFTPADALHKFARDTASTDKTVQAWMEGIRDHFVAANHKFVDVTYMGKNKFDKPYVVHILGIDAK